ncbi:MAG TPA: CHAT domain-containing protein [Streptosporangiaceae bacterium]
MRAYHPMVSAGGGNGQFTDDPADLLPLVFARPRDALAGAHSILAGRPPPHSASIAHQVIGLVERDFGDAAAGVRHLRTAVRLARRSGSPDREGDVLAALGIALIHTGRTADGLRALAAAGTLASGVTAARVRFRLAGALWVLGRHDEALVEVRPAIGALRRAGDTIWAARALTLRGLLQLALGATDRADRDFAAAEQLFATTSQEHDSAHAVQNRGLAAFRAGDLPGALRHLDAAGHRFQALGTSMPELSLDRCGVLLAAGLARDALAEADRAIARLDRRHGAATRRAELLLSAARAALAAGDPAVAADRAAHAGRLFAAQRRDWWSAHSRLLLLQARLAAGPVTGALAPDAARTAERLAALGSPESAQARLLAGRAALARGSRAEAGRQLAIAARDRRRGPPLTRASGWLAQALLAESAGQDRRALQACGRGLAVLSAHSLTLGATELRAQVTAHGQELAELAQRTCLRTGPPRRLLVWGERWRATAAATTPVHPPDDRPLQADLARYRDAASRLAASRAAGTPAPALQREQQQLERRIRAAQLRLPGPAGAAADAPLDVGALLAELGPGQLAEIIEVGGDLHVLLCGGGRVRRFGLGPAAAAVSETEYVQSALRRLAYGAAARPGEALAALGSAGGRLQELLLGAAARHLGDGPVVVVPPARLHAVPWAVLPALTARAVTVAPSARAWLRARAAGPGPAAGAVIVAGPALTAGAAEVAAVARMYDGATVLAGADATAARVMAALDGSGLAHIAAHGTFRSDSPLFSSLRLADGPLIVHDLERLRRPPYRLILPCCDSARLAAAGADELLGLTAALLPLGTAVIVASVGPVNDAAAAGLMIALHEGLRQGLSTAQALAGVRRAAERDGDPAAVATAWSFVALGAA